MAITYPLALPSTPIPRQVTMSGKNVTAMTESTFTLSQEVFRHVGEQWSAMIGLPPMTRREANVWTSWALSLRGQSGTFLLGDPHAALPTGNPVGTPLVNGAHAALSMTLATEGWTHSAQGVLLVGDYIQLGTGATSRLHKVLNASVNADGSGNATIDIWPRLRSAYSNGAAIVTSNAKGLFRLSDPGVSWDVDAGQFYGFDFGALEAI